MGKKRPKSKKPTKEAKRKKCRNCGCCSNGKKAKQRVFIRSCKTCLRSNGCPETKKRRTEGGRSCRCWEKLVP